MPFSIYNVRDKPPVVKFWWKSTCDAVSYLRANTLCIFIVTRKIYLKYNLIIPLEWCICHEKIYSHASKAEPFYIEGHPKKNGCLSFFTPIPPKYPFCGQKLKRTYRTKTPVFVALYKWRGNFSMWSDDIVRRIKKKGQFLIIDFGNLHLQGNARMGNNRPSLFIDSPSPEYSANPEFHDYGTYRPG